MKKLLILDSHSLIHRAYHALPPLETKKGETVNAIYGFFSILIKSVQDFDPNYIIATFDFPAPTFRHQKFKEYKIKRPPTPKDLSSQIPKIKESLNDIGIPVFEKKGFEADDIIGTICKNVSLNNGIESVIISGDKDLLQLVDSKTKVYLLKRGIKDALLCDIEKVKEMYDGLEPSQLIDYKSLRGDPSDNIPGVPGVGEKTAINLIKKLGSLEKIYKKIEKEKPKIAKKLVDFKKEAFLSRELALIKDDLSLKFDLEKCFWKGFNEEKTKKVFEKFEFYTLIKRITKEHSVGKNLSLF